MANVRQIESARRRARELTGSSTPDGAQRRHAELFIIPGEDPAEFEELAAAYHAEYAPATASRRYLVEQAVQADWQIRRFRRIQSGMLRELAGNASSLGAACLEDARGSNAVLKIGRQIAALQRDWERACAKLRESGGSATDGPPAPEPARAAERPHTPRTDEVERVLELARQTPAGEGGHAEVLPFPGGVMFSQ